MWLSNPLVRGSNPFGRAAFPENSPGNSKARPSESCVRSVRPAGAGTQAVHGLEEATPEALRRAAERVFARAGVSL